MNKDIPKKIKLNIHSQTKLLKKISFSKFGFRPNSFEKVFQEGRIPYNILNTPLHAQDWICGA